jgi:hypothetical protein
MQDYGLYRKDPIPKEQDQELRKQQDGDLGPKYNSSKYKEENSPSLSPL